MKFRSYPKIYRLGKDETTGILDAPVVVQEKVDGANVSIWNDNGEIKCGSRRQMLQEGRSFNGFVEYVNSNEELKKWLLYNPTKRLYGEWLVRHTIDYPATAFSKMYLFDITDNNDEVSENQTTVEYVAEILGLEYPKLFTKPEGEMMTVEKLEEFVGKSFIGDKGEGVVIKRLDFVNQFGDKVNAKMVSQEFLEKNSVTFGGNNKYSDSYNEMYIVNKYCTLARVRKNIQKLESLEGQALSIKDTPRIAGICYHDMITEDIWEIIKKTKEINFKSLQRLSYRKFIQIFHDILNDSVSVADRSNE